MPPLNAIRVRRLQPLPGHADSFGVEMRERTAGQASLVAAGGLLAAALFFGDGTSNGRLFWIASLAVIATAASLWAGPVPVPGRWGAVTLCLLGALTLWVGVSM